MPGPLPAAQSRRRNQATIATKTLPVEGRTGKRPPVPSHYQLAKPGRAWWNWAWKLPQATQWDEGSRYLIARRAQLEDELAALDFQDTTELTDLLAGANREAIENVEHALQALKRLASGSTAVMREMRELDNRLGLNPKALSELRWTIVDPEPPAEEDGDEGATDDYRARLG